MSLASEVWINILQYCDCESIQQIGKVDKFLRQISNDNYLWYKLICKHFIIIQYHEEKNYKKTYYTIHDNKYSTYLLTYERERIRDFDVWKYLCHKYKDRTVTCGKSLLAFTRYAEELNILYDAIDNVDIINNLCYHKSVCITFGNISDDNYIDTFMKYIKNPEAFCYKNDFGPTDYRVKSNILFYLEEGKYIRQLLKYVIDKNAYCWTKDVSLNIPLFYCQNLDQAKSLLEKVVDPVAYCLHLNFYGQTIITMQKNISIVKLILSYIPDKNLFLRLQDARGNTALHFGSTSKRYKLILESVDDPNEYCYIKNHDGDTALHTIQNMEDLRIILGYITDKQKIFYEQNILGETILHIILKRITKSGPYLSTYDKSNIKYMLDYIDDVDSFTLIRDCNNIHIRRYINYDLYKSTGEVKF